MDQFYIDPGYFDAGYFAYIASAEAHLDVDATVSVTPGVIKNALVSIQGAATATVTARAQRQAETMLIVDATVTAESQRVRNNVSTITSTVSLTVAADKIKTTSAALSAAVTTSTVAEIVKTVSVSMLAQTNFGAFVTSNAVTMSAKFGVTAKSLRIIADVSYLEPGYFDPDEYFGLQKNFNAHSQAKFTTTINVLAPASTPFNLVRPINFHTFTEVYTNEAYADWHEFRINDVDWDSSHVVSASNARETSSVMIDFAGQKIEAISTSNLIGSPPRCCAVNNFGIRINGIKRYFGQSRDGFKVTFDVRITRNENIVITVTGAGIATQVLDFGTVWDHDASLSTIKVPFRTNFSETNVRDSRGEQLLVARQGFEQDLSADSPERSYQFITQERVLGYWPDMRRSNSPFRPEELGNPPDDISTVLGSQMFAEFTLTAELTEFIDIEAAADLQAEFTVTAEADKFTLVAADSDINAIATTTTATTRIRNVAVNIDSAATATVTARAQRQGETALLAEFTTTTAAQRTRQSSSNITAVATVSADSQRTRTAAADKSVVATVDAEATVFTAQQFQAALSAVATVTVEGQFIDTVTAEANLSAEFTTTASAVLTRTASAALSSEATVSAAAELVRTASALLDSIVTVSADAEALTTGSAALSAAFTLTVDTDIFAIDLRTLLKIQPESRFLNINPETRLKEIEQETRIIKI